MISDGVADGHMIKVKVSGITVGCASPDVAFHVSLLGPGAVTSWMGKWSSCPLASNTDVDGREVCYFNCTCRDAARCTHVQLIRRSKILTVDAITWELCAMFGKSSSF